MSTIVPSVPWMPERAWTTCVSGGAISGLARSNYVPFAPQPYPPGMTAAEYAALDPAPFPGFGVPPPLDCFPRYVMWREDRIPDFSGGEPRISWTRQPGWQFRNDCVVPPVTTQGTCWTYQRGSESVWTSFATQIFEEMVGMTLTFSFGDGSPNFSFVIAEVDIGVVEWQHQYPDNDLVQYEAVLTITGGGSEIEWREEGTVCFTGFGNTDNGGSPSCYWVQFIVICNGMAAGVTDLVGTWSTQGCNEVAPFASVPFELVTDANGELLLESGVPVGAYQVDVAATPRAGCIGTGGTGWATQTLYPGLNYVVIELVPV